MTGDLARALRVTLLGGWTFLLLLQPGHAFDEGEHAHAAWLMARLGLRPLRDFFEHHPPLLWQVIGVYFRFGGDGPEALFFARVVATACVLAFAWALWRIGGEIAVLALIAISLISPTLFVSRPETLALGLFALAVHWWAGRADRASHPQLHAVASGIALGLALMASPRFLLLVPAPLLLDRDRRRWLVLAVSTVATVPAYLLLSHIGWRELWFDIGFSGALQHVGDGPPTTALRIGFALLAAALLLLSLAPPVLLLRRSGGLAERRWRVAMAWLLLTALACAASAGRFPYPQAFSPVVAAGLVLTAMAAATPGQEAAAASPAPPRTLALLVLLAATLGWLAYDLASHRTLPEWVAIRRGALDYARKRDRDGQVLMSPIVHPVAYRDASYYGMPLLESRDRLCTAVSTSRWAAELPPCDLAADIARRQPLIIDRRILRNLPPERLAAIAPLLRARYRAAGSFLIRTPDGGAATASNRTRLPSTRHSSTSSRRSAAG